MRVLFLARISNSADGGQVITKRNLYLLRSVFGEENVEVQGFDAGKSMLIFKRLFLALRGFLGDFTPKDLIKTKNILQNDPSIEYVFLDNSLLGACYSTILQFDVKSFTFFHNVESDYFRDALVSQRKLWYIIYWVSARWSERRTIKKSFKVIGLNYRDSIRLKKNYNRVFDLILPTSFNDEFSLCKMEQEQCFLPPVERLRILFVGSAFFANIQGLDWFLKNVFTVLKDVELYVVGSGFENLRDKYSSISNLEIIGRVEDLHPWYSCADVVISPIFKGSGMKTKIAEALMHGKLLLATLEAMAGYDWDGFDIGLISDSKEAMIAYLNQEKSRFKRFNPDSRRLFELKYSMGNAEKNLSDFFKNLDN